MMQISRSNRLAQSFRINDEKGFPAIAVPHIHCPEAPELTDFPAQGFPGTADHSCQLCLVKIDPHSVSRFHSNPSGQPEKA